MIIPATFSLLRPRHSPVPSNTPPCSREPRPHQRVPGHRPFPEWPASDHEVGELRDVSPALQRKKATRRKLTYIVSTSLVIRASERAWLHWCPPSCNNLGSVDGIVISAIVSAKGIVPGFYWLGISALRVNIISINRSRNFIFTCISNTTALLTRVVATS